MTKEEFKQKYTELKSKADTYWNEHNLSEEFNLSDALQFTILEDACDELIMEYLMTEDEFRKNYIDLRHKLNEYGFRRDIDGVKLYMFYKDEIIKLVDHYLNINQELWYECDRRKQD